MYGMNQFHFTMMVILVCQALQVNGLTNAGSGFLIRKVGAQFTREYEVYFENDRGEVISPFHDIPLFPVTDGTFPKQQDTFNMVVEIPRWTNAKFEINKETALNPIKQDISKDTNEPRFLYNVYPFKGYPWNYGALPQTWEDPNHITKDTNSKGDNDPIDVIEIGDKVGFTGQVKQVKLIGVLGLIDQGETDWKLVTIDVTDPLANLIKDIGDVEKYRPGLLEDTLRLFRVYKVPDGKEVNKIAFNNKYRNKDYALKLVYETHGYWQALVNGTTANNKIHCENFSVSHSPYKLPSNSDVIKSVPAENELPSATLPLKISDWSFVAED